MLDMKWIKNNGEEFDRLIARRGIEPLAATLIKLDEERRELTTLIQQLQAAKNEKVSLMSALRDRNNKEFEDARRDTMHINDKLEELHAKLANDDKLSKLLESLPNLPEEEVPFGSEESMNQVIRKVGEPKEFAYAKEHFDLGELLGMMDFSQTAKISGSRFVTLYSAFAQLERALINFMIDTHTKEFGFTEVSPPALVKDLAMFNAGLLPKFSDDSFQTTNDYRLIPTGEVPLVNLVADKIIAREKLPLRFVACTQSFRSEAGSAGRDTRGMIRLHQFAKVELVSITPPSESKAEHEYITNAAEEILKKLELPYRVVLLCSGEMGFHSSKTYDLEVWLPGQKKYREISSCSNCKDFQSRRMKTRFKEIGASENTYVHTLNGSGLAVGRTLIAILENYQNIDGSISIPKALIGYMGGMTKIQAAEELISG